MAFLLAATKTRPVFWDFTPWLKVLWYVLAVTSVAVFVYGCWRPIRRYRHGKGGPWPPCPWRELPGRLGAGAGLLFSHRTIERRDHAAGGAHGLIFYGFLVLFAGTVILGFDTDFLMPVFGISYFHGDFYLIYKEVLNVFGTLLIIGLLVMMIRRAFVRPAKLNYARPDRAPGDPQYDRRVYEIGDWVFVGTLLVIALTGFLLEGVRIAMSDPGYGGTQFGGWLVAQLLTGLSNSTLAALRHGIWWFHGLLAITFVASIPYTKAVAHAVELRLVVAARRQGRQAAAADPATSAHSSRPATARWRTSARCICSSSTRAPSVAAVTRHVRPTPPAARCHRAT